MRTIFFTAFALMIAFAVMPVLGQDMLVPRDIPANRLDEFRKRFAPVVDLDGWLRRCTILKRTAQIEKFPRGVCPFSCAPDDRKCEVMVKMHGLVGDDVGRPKMRSRGE